jgi:hypothetical protein
MLPLRRQLANYLGADILTQAGDTSTGQEPGAV